MKIIFFGTPQFAVPALIALAESKHEVSGVVTSPDRKSGRGLKVSSSPIKTTAQRLGLEVYQPEKVKDAEFQKTLSQKLPDMFVVLSFGQVLPASLLAIPRLYGINVHPSLLPRYRGAAPVNWALINGERLTGITLIRLSPSLDKGDIISQIEVEIDPEDSAVTLNDKLSSRIPPFLLDTLCHIGEGAVDFTPQDEAGATYAPRLKKEDGLIDWNMDAETIRNKVRSLPPWPCAYTYFEGKLLKLWKVEVVETGDAGFQPGEIVTASHREGIIVQAKGARVLLRSVQLEGKKRMNGEEFALGKNIQVGQMLERKST